MTGLWALDPTFRPWAQWLLDVARYNGLTVEVTSTRRTRAEQEGLYQAALAGRSRYPVARPGTSQHERGLALDLRASSGVLEALGGVWRSVGGTWGPSDPIHFGA